MKLQGWWSYPHLLLVTGLIGCSNASNFSEIGKVAAFAPISPEQKIENEQKQQGPKAKSKSAPMSEESDQERPTVEVAGVNLVPDCLSVPQENSDKDDLPSQINCQVRISKPANMMITRPRLEAVNTRGERVVLPEQRQVVQLPPTSKKAELIFSTRNQGEANSLKDVSTMVLAFDSVVVNGTLVNSVSTPVLVRPLILPIEGCADPKSYKWVKQTLRWDVDAIPPSPSGTQMEWESQIKYISNRLSAVLPPSVLPDLTTQKLCGAKFSGEMRKITADGSMMGNNQHFYSDRFVFTLNSRVLAADDLWRPLNLTSRPMFMNLYDPAILMDKVMRTILPQFTNNSMRTNFAQQRQQDVYCLGGKTNCFDSPVGGWVNEFGSFKAHELPEDMLRSLVAETLIRKEPMDFGIQVFGNGNFWSGFVDDSDSFPSNLKYLELDIELATE